MEDYRDGNNKRSSNYHKEKEKTCKHEYHSVYVWNDYVDYCRKCHKRYNDEE